MSNEPDHTETVEQTETGYRLTVKSTRGTGTRDQDKVEATAKAETLQQVKDERHQIVRLVKETMNERRAHQPGEDTNE